MPTKTRQNSVYDNSSRTVVAYAKIQYVKIRAHLKNISVLTGRDVDYFVDVRSALSTRLNGRLDP